ncbi:MAG: hypothetical protein AAB339_00445 [Elusimicrobiota bacterium]
MLLFIAVCLGIITLILLIGSVGLLYTLFQIKRTAMAVEALAYEAGDQIRNWRSVSERVSEFAAATRSGWVRALAVGVGVAAALWAKSRRRGS